jgi:hypothetical protein
MTDQISPDKPTSTYLLLRHGTDGFTSPPKEGMLWILSSEKFDGFGRVRTRDLGYERGSMLTARLLGITLNLFLCVVS